MKAGRILLTVQLACLTATLYAANVEERTVTITSTDRFDLVDGGNLQFQLLNDTVRALEITDEALSLGVTRVGQVRLKENVTALSALRGITDQISKGLGMNFGIIADSSTSEALRESELLLLYHPDVTLTLALIKSDQQDHYEIICTYVLEKKAPPTLADDETTIENGQPAETFLSPTQHLEDNARVKPYLLPNFENRD